MAKAEIPQFRKPDPDKTRSSSPTAIRSAPDETTVQTISIIIPALNEAAYLRPTIDALRRAFAVLPSDRAVVPEIVVADNGSTDSTVDVARALGATVVSEPVRGVARARNAGARAATGGMLVFLDADTIVPSNFAQQLAACAADPACLCGAFDTEHRPARVAVRVYLGMWRLIGLALGMAQGAAQFCRRGLFDALGGYDERLFMGEDVFFYWHAKRLARRYGGRAVYVRDARVLPSPRRFDQWPLWKTLVWTNPAIVGLLGRWRGAWRGWYQAPPR